MLRLFRNRRFLKGFSAYVILHLLTDWISPQMVHALTSGPSTPEFSSFEPVGTSELVNVSTGDFVYNIPLMDVEGYPINLAYHSGVNMDQEASMVGLGWSLNLGAINRNVRGIPDDFKGDEIRHEFSMKPNNTFGVNVSAPGAELVGFNLIKALSPKLGVSLNNYHGLGFNFSINPSIPAANLADIGPLGGMSYGLSLSYGNNSGIGISPSLSYTKYSAKTNDGGVSVSKNTSSISASFNSRDGMQQLSFVQSSTAWQGANAVGALSNHLTEKSNSSSSMGGAFHSFATPTYSPVPQTPYSQSNVSMYFTLGAEAFFADVFGGVGASASIQTYFDKDRLRRAYGYLYSDQSQNDQSLLDFNREKDGPYMPGVTPNLPLTNFTYDTYSATGQGLVGQFRAHRNDIGIVSDPYVANLSVDASLTGQLGAGAIFDAGGNVSLITSTSASGKWNKLTGNHLASSVDFIDRESIEDPLYESVYFKQVGELTPVVNQDFYSSIGGEKAIRPDIKLGPAPSIAIVRAKTNSDLIDRTGNSYTPDSYKAERDVRRTLFSALTAAEATRYGFQQQISYFQDPYSLANYYVDGEFSDSNLDQLARNDGDRQDHHISEISVTREDGARYVYGLPAYNWELIESSFSVDDYECNNGMVDYSLLGGAMDNSVNNEKGLDQFFSETTTPAYPYTHLLTSILSSNYVDNDGIAGPSDGDLGSWHKINYWKNAEEGRWRTPIVDNGFLPSDPPVASLNKGYMSDPDDDKASYTYGEKEIFFVHSVESQHYLAVFHYSERLDNLGAAGENSGLASSAEVNQMLDRIELFAKEELLQESISPGDPAVPIKTVHFSYEYLLTPGTPNTQSSNTNKAKLTLTGLSFSYGLSEEAKFSPYEFYYSDVNHTRVTPQSGTFNPDYAYRGTDRWGTYSPPCVTFDDECNCDGVPGNDEFPYVNQGYIPDTDPQKIFDGDRFADAYSRVWNLNTIVTPSGAQIDVDYESDDYAYVQNRQALQMCKIEGFSTAPGVSPQPFLYGPPPGGSGEHANYDYLILSLPENMKFPSSLANNHTAQTEFFKETMLSGLGEWLYLSVFTNLNKYQADLSLFEHVPVWVELDKSQSGLVVNPNPSADFSVKAYLKIVPKYDKDDGNGNEIQAVAKSAINFLRLNKPRYVTNPGQAEAILDDPSLDNKGIAKAILGFTNEVSILFKGYTRALYSRNYCREIDPARSWVRLGVPDKIKHGGGVRVRQITLHDQWNELSGGAGSVAESHSYGQRYDYTTTEKLSDGTERTISSGVAAYEPILGGDENPFRSPRFITEKFVAANDQHHFLLEPMGESFFPGPQVIYSKVGVSSLSNENITRHGTGKVIHEFFTARDYPTLISETDLKDYDEPPRPLSKPLKLFHLEGATASQGYVIRRNNMHGKPKAQWVYGEAQQEPISGVEYFYRSQRPGNLPGGILKSTTNRLYNHDIPVLTGDGLKSTATLGQDIDLIFDSNSITSTTVGGDLRPNVNGSFLGIIPVPFPLPSFFLVPVDSRSYFRSMTATKVVDNYGIMDKIVAHDLGATVTTENVLWDGVTGEVLMTKTHNEYNDPRYQTSYPAHWVYEGMGPAYQNHHARFENVTLGNGSLTANEASVFVPGDEVYWENDNFNTSGIGWVLDVTGSTVTVIDQNGIVLDADPGSGSSTTVDRLTIFRSGRRNLSTSPVAGIVSEQQPIQQNSSGDNVLDPDVSHDILSTGATTLREDMVTRPNTKIDGLPCKVGGRMPPTEIVQIDECYDEGSVVNPYYVGIRGNWVQDQAFSFLAERSASPDLRNSGFLSEFSPFWILPPTSNSAWTSDPANYTFTQEPTVVSSRSGVLESVDPLGIYSSAQFGYRDKLPVAQVSNAKYNRMGYDGFEDYDLASDCSYRHWPLFISTGSGNAQLLDGYLTNTQAHSGNSAIRLESNHALYSIQEVGDGTQSSGGVNSNGEYTLGGVDLQQYFAPDFNVNAPQKYLLSFWVSDKEFDETSLVNNLDQYLKVSLTTCVTDHTKPNQLIQCSSGALDTYSVSPVLDGWQRVEYVIELFPFCGLTVGKEWVLSIENIRLGLEHLFIDDIRIHPFNAVMNTYVYDSENLRLLAVGDANNFTRFYQYNPKGELVSVMVETEEGIKSVEEARYNTSK